MYKVGIVGCGFIGVKAEDSHLKAYTDCKDTEVIATVDKDFNITDLAGCEIVSICTPPETHLEIVKQVVSLLSIKAIYLEKPIANTLEDADEIIKLCDFYGVILQVNHQRRFMNPVMRFSRGILNTGTHALDLLRHLFGEPIEITKDQIKFDRVTVDIEYLDTEEPIFELDCCHNKDRMILKGVEHLVQCIKDGKQSISSGEDARNALELCLRYEKLVIP